MILDSPTSSPSVTLFGHWSCPYSTRVSFALAHREVAHTLTEVPPTKMRQPGFSPPTEFLEHSPLGEIPLVAVDNAYLADSLPIIKWLDVVTPGPPLVPREPAHRALALERARFVDQAVFSAMVGVYYGTRPDRIASASAALAAASRRLAAWLDVTSFLAGDTVTIADAALVPLWVRLELLSEVGLVDPLSPAAMAHRRRCQDLAAWDAIRWSAAERDELRDRILESRAERHDR